MCKITYYACGCCEKLIDRLSSKCDYDPRNILECMNLEERVSRAMYCESCGEACAFKKDHSFIARWREFKAQLEALKKVIIERCEHKAKLRAIEKEQRECKAHLKTLERAQPKVLEKAIQKAHEKEMIERRKYKAYLETLDEGQLEALHKAQQEAREKAHEKAIIDQRKYQALLEEFERGW
ncbi:hypothetical protein FIE12Z_2862 [Fusarium flagelliforme]|uniref:Uncharacterized protein n=1 Tax=Fusarium flagelliforme TaxID=2675880 RepID=A0A395N034_9HYPO|nr:hypothetical protein FIE12Z_2862 [Fusarium flagelliforme]